MKQPFPPHNRKECEDAAPDICYELTAMFQARNLHEYAKALKRPEDADAADVMRNCAIESFLLHYRALREFFNHADKVKVDDIKARDYVATWQPSRPWLKDTQEASRIHKRLAHLSTLRKTLDNDWDLMDMEHNASQTFEDFVAALTPDQQAWFSSVVPILKQRQPPAVATLLGDASSTASVTKGIISFPKIT